MADNVPEFITLQSEEGKQVKVSVEAARSSLHLKHFMESCDLSEPFPLPIIKFNILELVVEYLNQYKNKKPREMPRPLPTRNFRDIVSDWEYKFTARELSVIFELILAANYMDIRGLLDLCCAKVASEIRGRTVEELRSIFQIENDFTPEEEKQLREENTWCDPE